MSEMEELQSNFSDKLAVDDPQHLKRHSMSLKSKLIKKINENSQIQLAVLTNEKDKMKMLEENSQIIAELNSLPSLIEDGKREKFIVRAVENLIESN